MTLLDWKVLRRRGLNLKNFTGDEIADIKKAKKHKHEEHIHNDMDPENQASALAFEIINEDNLLNKDVV